MLMVCAGVGFMVSISVYLLLSTQLSRWLYGFILFSSMINVIILLLGRIDKPLPPIVSSNQYQNMANPLPQALVLTAIVIGFGLLAFVLVLFRSLLIKNLSLSDRFDPKSKAISSGSQDE